MRLPRWTPRPTNSQRPEKRLVSSLWGGLSEAILKLLLNPHEQAAGRLGRPSCSVGPRPGRHPRTGADRIPRPEGRGRRFLVRLRLPAENDAAGKIRGRVLLQGPWAVLGRRRP